MTGQDDPAAAGRDRLRAGHSDREHVVEALKDAFADGRLAKDEFDVRAGRALAARTYADLAALTDDIPAAARLPCPAAARLPRPPAPGRRPLARAAVRAGICLIIAFVAWWIAEHADTNPAGPGPHTFHFLPIPMAMVFITAGFTAIGILGHGAVTSRQLRRSRGQLPPGPGPGPGGHALEGERRAGPGHDPVPRAPGRDQTRADPQADYSRPDRRHIPARADRASRGVRPAPGTV
jgi:Domain of unknown function (DUF1707)